MPILEQKEKYDVRITHPYASPAEIVQAEIRWEEGTTTHLETREYPSIEKMKSSVNRKRLLRGLEFVAGCVAVAGSTMLYTIAGIGGGELLVFLKDDIAARVATGVTAASGMGTGTLAMINGLENLHKLSAISRKMRELHIWNRSSLAIAATQPPL